MTASEKATYWQQHFDDWKHSGLSQRDYCQRYELAYSSFGYWRQRLKNSRKPSSRFVPVTFTPSTTVIVTLPSGIRIETPVDSLAHVLSAVVT